MAMLEGKEKVVLARFSRSISATFFSSFLLPIKHYTLH